ncbi:MurB protein [Candidatus Pantoea carbekii]|uniref:UDP-N-acetylenolpyruvoylglucosamine reductase n=1 Tax=Candidatus Pantoea carbekii TaxID=1235990 RepID=U3U1M3_9GAMM|nr:MurB protein [Candidatus Pantoea carbekii]
MYVFDISLKAFNTFHLEIFTNKLTIVHSFNSIIEAWRLSQEINMPFMMLGEGSNVLFLEDFSGQIVINALKGIHLDEHDEEWHIHVGAGENWHSLVKWTLKNGIAGLENLAFIPGMVGSAAVQNIGAYGVEFKNFCKYVDTLHLPTQQTMRLSRPECQFGYRDSIFQHAMRNEYVIVAVGLCIEKSWLPKLSYGDLVKLNPAEICATDIFNAVYYMRQSKLPDPKIIGNVGSFFKNPIVGQEKAMTLLTKWPSMPYYLQSNGTIKLAAAWLIEQCNLKGYSIGGAAVHRKQAAVLINKNHATPNDIVILASKIRNKVGEKFHIWLEPEIRFIGAQGECNAIEVLS